MKNLILSLMLLMATSVMSVSAQNSLVATLNHNDTISVYYGVDALVNAYVKSVTGDVITLSSGNFNSCGYISKGITIRGAGMEQDTINKVAPTILNGNLGLGDSNNLTFEGIWHVGTIYYDDTPSGYGSCSNVQFIKCRLNSFQKKSSSSFDCYIYDAKFIQCKIKNITANGDAQFINCYVGAPGKDNTSSRMYFNCTNCVVYGSLVDVHVESSIFTNCILIGSNVMDESNMISNCIGVYTNTTDTINNLFTNSPSALIGNVCFRSAAEVFKTFRAPGTDNVTDAHSFELQDSIRTKYLGTDGLEIGMYGGPLPFNPRNTLPKIKKFKVAPQSNAEGKLSVEIEVSAASE